MTTPHIGTPRPYQVDDPIMAVQTPDSIGGNRIVTRHVLAALTRDNFDLLVKREKDTKRVTERVGKDGRRHHSNETEADAVLYRALMESAGKGGGWRPGGLTPVADLEMVEPSHRELFMENTESGMWEPTHWFEIPVGRMLTLNTERQAAAMQRALMCKAEHAPDELDISFMFEEAGVMRMRFLIGDPEEPAYRLLMNIRRPESQRRAKFRDSFAYSIDRTKAEGGKSEMRIDLHQGVGFFDEHFGTILEDPAYSQVTMRAPTRVSDEPTPISAVPVEGEDEFVPRVPYTDSMRGQFLKHFNPYFRVEIASTTVLAFNNTDRD